MRYIPHTAADVSEMLERIGVKNLEDLFVEVPGSVLILGVTNDRITLLSQIEDQAVLDKIHQAESTGSVPSFAEHLNKMVSRIKAVKDD